MSLLLLEQHQKAAEIAKQICEHAEQNTKNGAQHGGGSLPYDGMVQTIILLDLSVRLDDKDFFCWTSVWTYVLMSTRMKNVPDQQVKFFIMQFCRSLKEELWWLETDEEKKRAGEMLDAAIETVRQTDIQKSYTDYIDDGAYEGIRKQYLQCLLDRDMSGAAQCFNDALKKYSLPEVYTKIIQNVMYEVGDLWLHNRISVAQEHYCTATTQTILSMIYPQLMERSKNGKKVLVACVGSELHELGARMVSDIFEYEGWDSVFLGAAVPLNALMQTIEDEKPDLLALSVALQQQIKECAEEVDQIKEKYPSLFIAVGGQAFVKMTKASSLIHADLLATTEQELMALSQNFGSCGKVK